MINILWIDFDSILKTNKDRKKTPEKCIVEANRTAIIYIGTPNFVSFHSKGKTDKMIAKEKKFLIWTVSNGRKKIK